MHGTYTVYVIQMHGTYTVYVIQMHGTYPVLKQLSRLEPSSFLLLFRNVGRMAVEYTKVSWIFFFSGCLVGAKYARR
jgi:hypothetical protein